MQMLLVNTVADTWLEIGHFICISRLFLAPLGGGMHGGVVGVRVCPLFQMQYPHSVFTRTYIAPIVGSLLKK